MEEMQLSCDYGQVFHTDSSINASRRWTLTREMNKNTIIAKGPRTTGRTDGRTYYSATQGILPPAGLVPLTYEFKHYSGQAECNAKYPIFDHVAVCHCHCC